MLVFNSRTWNNNTFPAQLVNVGKIEFSFFLARTRKYVTEKMEKLDGYVFKQGS